MENDVAGDDGDGLPRGPSGADPATAVATDDPSGLSLVVAAGSFTFGGADPCQGTMTVQRQERC